ncbi:Aminoglycoside phosphotransferase [Frankia sp. AiPs1]|uniref:phosphotransferase n=1 Tax=Frankia sp. AiPa1 TaxID=573492 RepID=UPI00202ADFE8|nr:phosphotransferase [Frankia sp. AiPa1]MCL9761627.1 phosphotransferase [Frankia sp. AiPa1]
MADRTADSRPGALAAATGWADITARWMTEALAEHHPDAEISRVDLAMRDDGTNRRARFDLTYAAGSGPGTVFLKRAERAHAAVNLRNGTLFIEPDLFASRVPLPVDHPLMYRVVIDRPALDFTLVMEDVTRRGADPRDSTRPMTADQVAHGLRGLARLHSRYWGFSATTHPELAWMQTWEPTDGFSSGLRTFVPRGLERGVNVLPARVAAHSGDEVVDLWARYVGTLGRDPVTLLHGDAHIGNTYVLPGDQVGFLDWQVAHRGGWCQDVGYFLVGALTVEDRRQHERALIAEYRDALDLPEQARPSIDLAWLRYRASAAYGLAIWLSTLGTDGWQRHEISLALTERYAAAFADLDTPAALVGLSA